MVLGNELMFGALAGAIPTVSMISASLFTMDANLSSGFQASAQNLCAGWSIG